MSFPVPRKRLDGKVVPTGPALLALIQRTGDEMLLVMESDHDRYLAMREVYLELLVFAERDAYCAPILITTVQAVFDEESRQHRERQRRVDNGR